ncbi:asparagine synthase (glutamine-hydrolyzing) [Nocardiopsis algeriensis]|uniref:Asparagine synthase (Glutamine-hydrolyzing) n=1 Tax=Nocardiopsis algeriensis TaxID=1478215 RepID=A0A841IMP9_9ACTN|nr:asparagine synthase (glutamine-hydrolyzing) [Nocardiopsis algeriensis]
MYADDLAAASAPWSGSFTAVRATPDTVEVVTDAAGACPVYTVRTPDGLVVWGSSSRALAGLNGARVDQRWLAAYIGDRHSAPTDLSAWEGVAPVPPGHRLLLTADDTRTEQWWRPVPLPREEALERIRTSLVEGVRARSHGLRMSTDLAGVDSSALAVLSAKFGPVTGVTAHPEDAPEEGDLGYARALSVPGLCLRLFPMGEDHLPFSTCAGGLPPTDEPPPSAVSWAAFSGQLHAVGQDTDGCHLTGDGGDNLFLPPPTHLLTLARQHRWVGLWRDACAWARLRRRSPWPYVRAALAGDANALSRSAPDPPPWLCVPPPERVQAAGADDALVRLVRSVARAAASDIQLADHVGVEQHNPYLDGAVLGAVVSLAPPDRFSAYRYKPALMDALGDLLPPVVRGRTTKGAFVRDYHRAVRVHLRSVLDMCDGPLADAGLVDPEKLRSAVRAAALGARVPWAHLVTSLGANLWWESVSRTPVCAWGMSGEVRA